MQDCIELLAAEHFLDKLGFGKFKYNLIQKLGG